MRPPAEPRARRDACTRHRTGHACDAGSGGPVACALGWLKAGLSVMHGQCCGRARRGRPPAASVLSERAVGRRRCARRRAGAPAAALGGLAALYGELVQPHKALRGAFLADLLRRFDAATDLHGAGAAAADLPCAPRPRAPLPGELAMQMCRHGKGPAAARRTRRLSGCGSPTPAVTRASPLLASCGARAHARRHAAALAVGSAQPHSRPRPPLRT